MQLSVATLLLDVVVCFLVLVKVATTNEQQHVCYGARFRLAGQAGLLRCVHLI